MTDTPVPQHRRCRVTHYLTHQPHRVVYTVTTDVEEFKATIRDAYTADDMIWVNNEGFPARRIVTTSIHIIDSDDKEA